MLKSVPIKPVPSLRTPSPPAAGVGLFGMKSSSKVTRKLASPNAPLGYTLCLVNLVLDGYTNASQVGPRPGPKAPRAHLALLPIPLPFRA